MLALSHRGFGRRGDPVVVILHGLLGSGRNWQTVAGALASTHRVATLDLRNHGESPHHPTHDYPALEADLMDWMDAQDLGRVTLLGHSMGGKVAMAFACHRPERLERLVVVDIAPRAYDSARLGGFLDAMLAVDLPGLGSRAQAEARLQEAGLDSRTAKFLTTNLERAGDGRFFWRANVAGLRAELAKIAASPLGPSEPFAGPTLFVVGGASDHVQDADHSMINLHFPNARIEVMPGVGHLPHVEAREAFVEVLRRFL